MISPWVTAAAYLTCRLLWVSPGEGALYLLAGRLQCSIRFVTSSSMSDSHRLTSRSYFLAYELLKQQLFSKFFACCVGSRRARPAKDPRLSGKLHNMPCQDALIDDKWCTTSQGCQITQGEVESMTSGPTQGHVYVVG